MEMSGRANYDRKVVDAVAALDDAGIRPKVIAGRLGLTRGQVAGLLYRLRRGLQAVGPGTKERKF